MDQGKISRWVSPRRIFSASLSLLVLFLFACGGGGGSASPNSGGGGGGGSNPGNPGGNGNGPGGKGGTALPYESAFMVDNPASVKRSQVIQVSVPFPQGKVSSLDKMSVKDHSTCWRVLERWPDGSIRVAQAQFTDTLEPNESKRYEVVSGTDAWKGKFERNPWVSALWKGFSMVTEVKDVDGVPYYAAMTGAPEVLEETPLVKTVRYHVYHVNPDPNAGIKRDFLSLTVYLTEYRTVPVVKLDLVLGNDYLGADDPGGSKDPNLYPLMDVYLKEFNLLVENNPVLFRFAAQNEIGKPQDRGSGIVAYPLLKDTYLGDGQDKKWTALVLFLHPNGDPSQKAQVMNTWTAMANQPLHPLATLKAWQGSGAMGIFGGPVDPPSSGREWAEKEYESWLAKDHFGPFGSWGEVKYAHTTGTPRNGPFTDVMLHIVQTGNQKLVNKLEGMAWQQACRPYHLWNLKIMPEDDIYLWGGIPLSLRGGSTVSAELLGRKKLVDNDPYKHWRKGVDWGGEGPHGWNAYDREHWTTDILFDYWTLTGDWWARQELATMGECLMGLMRPVKYSTRWPQAARCEGWTLMSAVQIWLATGNERIKNHFLDRIHRIIEPFRHKDHPSKAICFQSDYAGTGFPLPHKFYIPWQHGPVFYGLLAAARFWKDSVAESVAEDTLTTIKYAWIHDYNTPNMGYVADGIRYYVPVEYQGKPIPADFFDNWKGVGVKLPGSPLGSVNLFIMGGLFLLSDTTKNRAISDEAARLGGIMLKARMAGGDGWRWDRWSAVVPEYHIPKS